MCKIFFWFLYLVSLLLYAVTPNVYSYEINALAGILLVISIVLYFKIKRVSNIFCFDTLFLLAFSITFFVYPIFLYPINPQYFALLSYPFNEDVITRATVLSLVGANSYMCGNLMFKQKKAYLQSKVLSVRILDLKIFVFLLYVSFAAFIVSGGISYYKDLYQGNGSNYSGLFGYFNIVVRSCVVIVIVLQFLKIKYINSVANIKGRWSRLILVFFALYFILLLSTGARGAVLSAILVLIWGYTYYVRPLRLFEFIILVFIGALVLSLIGLYRIDTNVENFRFWDLFMDLIINNRNTFVAIDYVDQNGITYGKSMLGCVLRVIPFLSGIVHKICDLNPDETVSSMILTIDTLGEEPEFGLGTSIIADLYLAFGFVGVVLFMYLLGYFIRYLEFGIDRHRLYSVLIYAILISYSIFMVRGEYFYSLNQIIICLFLFWLITKHCKSIVR